MLRQGRRSYDRFGELIERSRSAVVGASLLANLTDTSSEPLSFVSVSVRGQGRSYKGYGEPIERSRSAVVGASLLANSALETVRLRRDFQCAVPSTLPRASFKSHSRKALILGRSAVSSGQTM